MDGRGQLEFTLLMKPNCATITTVYGNHMLGRNNAPGAASNWHVVVEEDTSSVLRTGFLLCQTFDIISKQVFRKNEA